jgi:hypothetical protein
MSFEHQPPHEGNLETFAVATRRVIRFSVGYLLVSLLTAVLLAAGVLALNSGAADPMSPGTAVSYLVGSMILGTATLICVLGLLISTIVWIISAHRVSPAGPGITGYGGLLLTVLLIALSYQLTVPALAQGGIRIGGWLALIAGVILTRSRIRRETSRPDLGGARKPIVTGADWDASKWDPEVQRDIERRGRPDQVGSPADLEP